MRFKSALLVALLLGGCESTPEETCTTTASESSLDIDCTPSENGTWADEALEEAEEGFERRRPGGRN